MTTTPIYSKMRKAGHGAADAWRTAKIVKQFEELESDGLVRLRAEPEQESYFDVWNVSDLRIDRTIDPLLNADLHAGVHLIRNYYPEFIPTAQHFEGAYRGTKPVAVC